jgi:hypothetical protein
LIEKQRTETFRILSEVVEALKQEDMVHKMTFRDKKLTGSFGQVLYAFEKISDELHGTAARGMSTWACGELQSSLDEFEKLLQERGLEINTYDSIKYACDKIRYPLGELLKFLAGEASEIPSTSAAIVFADALASSFSELRGIAEGIDNEYSAIQK